MVPVPEPMDRGDAGDWRSASENSDECTAPRCQGVFEPPGREAVVHVPRARGVRPYRH